MPLSPPKNRTDFALVVMFIITVMTVADVAAITLLGSNANSTFQYVRPSPKPLPALDSAIPLTEAAGNEAPTPRPLPVAPAPRPAGERP